MTDHIDNDIDDEIYKKHDHGPLRTYEVTWANGHVERIQGHQVTMPSALDLDGLGAMFGHVPRPKPTPRVMIHGEFDGHWRMVLAAAEHLIAMVRDVTDGEAFGDVIA